MSVGPSIDFQSPLKQEPPTFARPASRQARSATGVCGFTALYNWSWSSIRGWPIHSRTRELPEQKDVLITVPRYRGLSRLSPAQKVRKRDVGHQYPAAAIGRDAVARHVGSKLASEPRLERQHHQTYLALNAAAVNTGKPPRLLGKRAPQCNTANTPNGRNIEFSEDPTRIVPCDAVAIGGKLVQNNGIELCAPDRCWDHRTRA